MNTIAQNSKRKTSERGFTLIEIIIAIGVMAIISTTLFIGFSTATESAELKTSAFKIVDALQFARTRTIASLASSSYGIHFEQTYYVLFRGVTYSALDPDNILYPLPSSVEIVSVTLAGGGSDVVFDRITGKTAHNGTVSVRVVANPTKVKIIEIAAAGRSDVSADALPPAGTRVSDTRHVHFTYAQNVQGAGTLTLKFPNANGGPLVQNINFQDYISGGAFDWSGTITVNGSPQVLKIHTHSMDALGANFSITRDLRYNNEALEIYYNADDLINYSPTGVATENSFWIQEILPQ
ncbi:MAG: prepilin-type N-terminal cleavage/methylation domain-containing protein [Candidatus Azambacteria bacterium]|nr:prepilin-type N-terminal cleavage/methylation domain-containing protein [Candidatus Azambacteria bacterium]